MSEFTEELRAALFAMQDKTYRDFQAGLIPNVAKENIIGVRIPKLRKYAKGLVRDPRVSVFLEQLPHQYYDENNVHAFVVEQIQDYRDCLRLAGRFLPYIDNWATCDMFSPKVFAKHKEDLLIHIREWIASGRTYTVRFGIGMLMRYYLEEDFDEEYLALVAGLRSEEYYINMMVAWYFATALAKQYDAALPYLQEERLAVWTHNKAIQKACESYRVAPEQKEDLRRLKKKETP